MLAFPCIFSVNGDFGSQLELHSWERNSVQGEGRVRPGSAVSPGSGPGPQCHCLSPGKMPDQDSGVCVKETPKGIPEGQHRGPSFPWPLVQGHSPDSRTLAQLQVEWLLMRQTPEP